MILHPFRNHRVSVRGERDLELGAMRSTNPKGLAVGDMPTVARQLLSYQTQKFELCETPFSMIRNIRTIEIKMTTPSKPKEIW